MSNENEVKNQELDLFNNGTYIDLGDISKPLNKKKINGQIDQAKEVLDSIYSVCEQFEEKTMNKINTYKEKNKDCNIVMTGTDYHGDRRCFQSFFIKKIKIIDI